MKFLWLIISIVVMVNDTKAGDLVYKSGFENTALVSGNVTGLSSSTLKLNLKSGLLDETISINANGNFVFFTDIPVGDNWTVSLVQLPNTPNQQTCQLSNQSGTMTGSGADTLTVNCDQTSWNWDEMNWDEGGWN